MLIRIALIGDRDERVIAHRAIPEALRLAADECRIEAEWTWHDTGAIPEYAAPLLGAADAVWCVPASPYASTAGALAAIRFAREARVPFLGTCGGFQHAILEYAASCWGITAAHAELDPTATDPVIAPLACSLVEEQGAVRFAPGSRLAALYGSEHAVESYHCRYGLGAAHVPRLAGGPLRAAAWDDAGDVRAVELDGHPFFIATLFQPERSALAGAVPAPVRGLLAAARDARPARVRLRERARSGL